MKQIKKFKAAFFLLEANKSSGADGINLRYVIKRCSGDLCGPLKKLFDLSLQSGVFPELLKVAIISPVF